LELLVTNHDVTYFQFLIYLRLMLPIHIPFLYITMWAKFRKKVLWSNHWCFTLFRF